MSNYYYFTHSFNWLGAQFLLSFHKSVLPTAGNKKWKKISAVKEAYRLKKKHSNFASIPSERRPIDAKEKDFNLVFVIKIICENV